MLLMVTFGRVGAGGGDGAVPLVPHAAHTNDVRTTAEARTEADASMMFPRCASLAAGDPRIVTNGCKRYAGASELEVDERRVMHRREEEHDRHGRVVHRPADRPRHAIEMKRIRVLALNPLDAEQHDNPDRRLLVDE